MTPSRASLDLAVRRGASTLLGLLLVTYWWVADRGVQDLGGWAAGLDRSAG